MLIPSWGVVEGKKMNPETELVGKLRIKRSTTEVRADAVIFCAGFGDVANALPGSLA